ncbi:MAG: MgtC/SapB family protein [Gemmatimonadetes bacterium]|nr:MgtC/SapB family protein [Gemmatimonadota bacterium]
MPTIDFSEVAGHLMHLGIAYLLALPLALDREKEKRSAGLRTFPLVAIGVCAFMLTGLSFFEGEEARARLAHGLLTGMGFIGGGAILRRGDRVAGTATAASLWNTGGIGMAVAMDRYEIAVVLALVSFLTLRYISRIKREVPEKRTES